jgi:chromosome segregation ATPase
MSDTPETDKNVLVGLENADRECVPVDFCRKLERERDEANYFLKELAEVDGQLKLRINELCGVLQKAEQERDELREELNDIRLNLGDDAKGYTLLHAVCALQNERDELWDQLNALREHWS